jgi:two-component sensor histidine kinase/PAS domain-containing protein
MRYRAGGIPLQWDKIIAISVFVISVGILLVAGLYFFRKGKRPAATVGVWLAMMTAGWVLMYALEMNSTGESAIIFWNKLKWIFIPFVPVIWTIMVLAFTGYKEWTTDKRLFLLFVLPIVIVILVFTNDFHHMMWRISGFIRRGSFLLMMKAHHPGYYFYILYAYGMIGITSFILIRQTVRSHQLFKQQGFLLVCAVLLPFIGSLFDVLNITFLNMYDLTSVAFALSAPLVALVFPSLRIGTIIPVARHTVVDKMEDSVIVLDDEYRVVDLNQAAETLFSVRAGYVVGMHVDRLWPQHPFAGGEKIVADDSREVKLNLGHGILFFDLSISSITDMRGHIVSRVIVLRNITKRRDIEDRLTTSLQEKEVLLKEIHHRVKNNLQVICSLLNLQSGHIKDKETLDLFQQSQNRIRSMALVHELLYLSEDFSSVNFKEYTHQLADQLISSYGLDSKLVNVKMDLEDAFLNIDEAIPCGLIISELVSNSMKHAFLNGRGGEIMIGLHRDVDNRYALTVGDNGVGMPKDLDFKETKTLGLQVVNTLVDQLNGNIELDRSSGTYFRISFTN